MSDELVHMRTEKKEFCRDGPHSPLGRRKRPHSDVLLQRLTVKVNRENE